MAPTPGTRATSKPPVFDQRFAGIFAALAVLIIAGHAAAVMLSPFYPSLVFSAAAEKSFSGCIWFCFMGAGIVPVTNGIAGRLKIF